MDWIQALYYIDFGILTVAVLIEIVLIITFLKVPKLRKHPNNYIFWQFIWFTLLYFNILIEYVTSSHGTICYLNSYFGTYLDFVNSCYFTALNLAIYLKLRKQVSVKYKNRIILSHISANLVALVMTIVSFQISYINPNYDCGYIYINNDYFTLYCIWSSILFVVNFIPCV